MLRTAIFISILISGILYSQTIDLSGKWASVNEEYNYKMKYKIEKVKEKFRGILLYFEMDDEKYTFEEDDQIEMLKDFKFENAKELSGTYFDPEEQQEYKATIKITDKNNLKLIIKDGDESLIEKFSRMLD